MDEGTVAIADLAVGERSEHRLDTTGDPHKHTGGAGRGDGKDGDVPPRIA